MPVAVANNLPTLTRVPISSTISKREFFFRPSRCDDERKTEANMPHRNEITS